MFSKKQILQAIVSLARRLGRTPSLLEFVSRTRISKYSVIRLFAKWNNAVRAAGLAANTLIVSFDANELLRDWGETVRKSRAIPTRRAYRRKGKYDPRTIERQCGLWSSLPQVFRDFAKGKPEWADVLALLPDPARVLITPCRGALQRVPSSVVRTPSGACYGRRVVAQGASPAGLSAMQHTRLKDRSAYGNPINFPGFRHEPVNEQGVVLLFGMLAKDLGYTVEAVQKGFPDCEAKRQIAPDRWQRVLIEFEFESKNFHQHGHPVNGCDVIVCWRHNWPACPKHIEVLELSSLIKSPAG